MVLDNGQVHYFENDDHEESGSFTIRSHKIQSIALGFDHSIMVIMRGAIFGFGCNNDHQLGVVDPNALLGDITFMPTEVIAAVTKLKGTTIPRS